MELLQFSWQQGIMSIIKSTLTFIFIIFFLVVPGRTGNTDRSHLPHRDALATDVKFWKIVFAELSLDQYLIHDSDEQRLCLLVRFLTRLIHHPDVDFIHGVRSHVQIVPRKILHCVSFVLNISLPVTMQKIC